MRWSDLAFPDQFEMALTQISVQPVLDPPGQPLFCPES
jgi:hypothetical protein